MVGGMGWWEVRRRGGCVEGAKVHLLGLELHLHLGLVFVGTDVHDNRLHLLHVCVDRVVGHSLPARVNHSLNTNVRCSAARQMRKRQW